MVLSRRHWQHAEGIIPLQSEPHKPVAWARNINRKWGMRISHVLQQQPNRNLHPPSLEFTPGVLGLVGASRQATHLTSLRASGRVRWGAPTAWVMLDQDLLFSYCSGYFQLSFYKCFYWKSWHMQIHSDNRTSKPFIWEAQRIPLIHQLRNYFWCIGPKPIYWDMQDSSLVMSILSLLENTSFRTPKRKGSKKKKKLISFNSNDSLRSVEIKGSNGVRR